MFKIITLFTNNIWSSIAFMIAITSIKNIQYDTFNFIYLLFVFMFKESRLYGIVACNTIAITTTWYLALCYDNSIIYRIMKKYDLSLLLFLLGDAVFHVGPLGFILLQLFSTNTFYKEIKDVLLYDPNNQLIIHSGLYSVFLNLLWSLLSQNGFELNSSYYMWNLFWIINISTHVTIMCWINHVLNIT